MIPQLAIAKHSLPELSTQKMPLEPKPLSISRKVLFLAWSCEVRKGPPIVSRGWLRGVYVSRRTPGERSAR